jgi:murein DD-endopeptidase MepM/ murein hydrolase activator NlpD
MRFGNPVKGRIGRLGHPDPVSKFVVTRVFADLSMPQHGSHDGLDIDNGGPPGDPILAMADGKVSEIRVDSNGAKIVRISHDDKWSTGYAHLATILVERRRQPVVRGQQIGTLGATGAATGPHLHFDISRDGRRRDPWPLLDQNQTDEEEWMPLPLRERYERWTVPAGTQFFTEGPGIGPAKKFTTDTKVETVAESVDNKWRLLRFQNSAAAPREILYVRRRGLVPKVQGGEPAYDARVVAAIKGP